MPQIPIYIINLEQSKDRLKRICSELDFLGLDYERFPAVNGLDLEEEEVQKYFPNKYMWWARRELQRGEIGCALSHIKLFQLIQERGIERACILEDDAIIGADFKAWIMDHTPMVDKSHILKLTINSRDLGKCRGIKVQRYSGRDICFLPRRGVHGTYGYIINREGLKLALDNLRVAFDAIDHSLFEYWNSQIVTYHTYPPVITTGEDSIIGRELRSSKMQRYSYDKPLSYKIRRFRRDLINFYRRQKFMLKIIGPSYIFRKTRLSQASM